MSGLLRLESRHPGAASVRPARSTAHLAGEVCALHSVLRATGFARMSLNSLRADLTTLQRESLVAISTARGLHRKRPSS